MHATSKFPSLKAKITTDTALTVLNAEAHGNLLGDDYRKWYEQGCTGDGWTPFGLVRRAIEVTAKR